MRHQTSRSKRVIPATSVRNCSLHFCYMIQPSQCKTLVKEMSCCMRICYARLLVPKTGLPHLLCLSPAPRIAKHMCLCHSQWQVALPEALLAWSISRGAQLHLFATLICDPTTQQAEQLKNRHACMHACIGLNCYHVHAVHADWLVA